MSKACKIIQLATQDEFIPDYQRMRVLLWPGCADEVDEILADAAHWAVFLAITPAQEPVGFAEVRLREYADGTDASPVPFLEGWFVDEAHRRLGVGRQLLDAAECWAEEHGFSEMASDALVENDGGIAAHRQLGYHEIERRVCFVKKLGSHGQI